MSLSGRIAEILGGEERWSWENTQFPTHEVPDIGKGWWKTGEMERSWNKEMVVQDVGQKQQKERGGWGGQFKSIGKIKADGKKLETPRDGWDNTRYSCENSFGIMFLKVNFKVFKQVSEQKNLPKITWMQKMRKELFHPAETAACGNDYRDDCRTSDM